MSPEVVIPILRVAVLAGLYLFLLQVLFVIARDLGRGQRITESSQQPHGRLLVVAEESDEVLSRCRFDLAPVTTIGRDPANVVALPDSFVSTRHAVLSWHDDGWWLEDLGSTNGTSLNAKPVHAPTAVAFGDTIRIGRIWLKLTRG